MFFRKKKSEVDPLEIIAKLEIAKKMRLAESALREHFDNRFKEIAEHLSTQIDSWCEDESARNKIRGEGIESHNKLVAGWLKEIRDYMIHSI